MENSVLNEVLKAVIIASLPALFALMAALFAYLRAWVEAKTRETWLGIISREAFDVVAAVAQTVADPIKEAAKDGKLSPEESQRIKQIALETLTARLKEIPAHLFPDLGKRLGDAIESAVPQVKSLAPSNPPQSPVSK